MVKRLSLPSAPDQSPWIWLRPAWPNFEWDDGKLANPLARARVRQGEVLGAARLLDAGLSREAQAQVLIQDGINTSAIEGERFVDPHQQNPGVTSFLVLLTTLSKITQCIE